MKRLVASAALAVAAVLPSMPGAQTPAAPAPSAQAPAAPVGDPIKGSQKVAMCQGCHGIPGWRTAFPEVYSVPKLTGQKPGYLVSALKAYKSGERDFATMRAIAADLSEQDMEDIAAYYGQSNTTTAAKK